MRSVVEKLGIKTDTRMLVKSAPDSFLKMLHEEGHSPTTRLSGQFSYIHVFVITASDLLTKLKSCKSHLSDKGMLWVSWPKNNQLETDLTLPEIIKIGYDEGLVESKVISIDDTWSAMKFTHPVKGRKYNNSFGTLPE